MYYIEVYFRQQSEFGGSADSSIIHLGDCDLGDWIGVV